MTKSESKYQQVQDKSETIEKRLETGLEYYSPNASQERGENASKPGRQLWVPGSLCARKGTPLSIPRALVCFRRPHPGPSLMRPSWSYGDGESHPFWPHFGGKRGPAIVKGAKSNCATPWLGESLVSWGVVSALSSTKGMASCGATLGATQGRPLPWGLAACGRYLLRHDGLAWSGPGMLWNWKSGQEPNGPASERNPSEPPKIQFAERGREHSSWRSFWGQENECGGERYLCDDSLAPWSGPE